MAACSTNQSFVLSQGWAFVLYAAEILSEKIFKHPEVQANNPEQVSDIEDVRASRQGDPDAYKRLIERHQQQIGKIMWRFSRDPMVHEELVQDVFVEAYLSIGTYREKAPFEHWLAKIATRVGYHYWKQKERQKNFERFSFEDWDQITTETPEEIEPGRAAELLHSLLGQLPPRDRIVLTLRYLEGCDVARAAHRLGWTKSMVKVQTNRAKKKLEKLLAQIQRREL
ncbi:MAG: RNA polymerase sigma factor [Sedimentisphaerales bacterium]|nr:RNA polymerase sigma factor [Sedimentisphaerales bacterium]